MPTVASGDASGDTATRRATPTQRLARAWREMRRGPVTGVVVELLFGRPGEPDAVDPTHLDVLDLLASRDGRRMSELAARLRVDPSTITRTMHRMEAAGLARRATTEADGRVVTAHLTDEGRRLHDVVAARRQAIVDAGLRDLTPAEQEQLVDLLERFLAAVGRNLTTAPDATAG